MLATVEINHDQHISFTQSRLTDAVSVILSELLSYEHPPKVAGIFVLVDASKGTGYNCGYTRQAFIEGECRFALFTISAVFHLPESQKVAG